MLRNLERAPVDAPAADRAEWPRAVLFDLDGTLIDSVPDLATSVNRLLESNGLACLAANEVRPMIGNGVKKLVQRAFAARDVQLEGQRLEFTTERMMGIYREHLTVETSLMAAAAYAVTNLAGTGVRIGVVTNKPEELAWRILDHFALSQWMSVVVGGDTGPSRKPAPDMLRHALAEIGVSAAEAVLVGDSPADIDAAHAVPMESIAVRGGYTSVAVDELGADIVIDSLAWLPTAIQNLREPV